MTEQKETTWKLFECERGNRWSESSYLNEWFTYGEKTGSVCYFSGCKQDHAITLVKEKASREEAGKWFHNANIKVVA